MVYLRVHLDIRKGRSETNIFFNIIRPPSRRPVFMGERGVAPTCRAQVGNVGSIPASPSIPARAGVGRTGVHGGVLLSLTVEARHQVLHPTGGGDGS